MPLLILLSLIAFFLLSKFGNAFVLHTNKDSKLHRRRATSMNKQTMKKQMMQQQTMNKQMMQAVPNVESQHVKTRVKINLDSSGLPMVSTSVPSQNNLDSSGLPTVSTSVPSQNNLIPVVCQRFQQVYQVTSILIPVVRRRFSRV